MKTIRFSLFIFLVVVAFSCSDDRQKALNTEIPDLDSYSYYESGIPSFALRIWSMEPAEFNKRAALGRILFYDTRLSKNNSISCASCHNQSSGFAENKRFSKGLFGESTTRNSMALVNSSWQNVIFWEGHSGYMQNILNPVSNHIELGMRSKEELVAKLKEEPKYVEYFQDIYGEDISEENLSNAVGAFVGSIVSYKSKFDQGININFENFTSLENSGRELFNGKALCAHCHTGKNFVASWRRGANIGLEKNYDDEGFGEGHFKVPTLRNIALTAPYMHDGRFQTLEEVIDHYSHGVQDHPNLDWALTAPGLDLTVDEKQALIAFLHTLTDHSVIVDPKFANPF